MDTLKHRNGKKAFFRMSSPSEIMRGNFAVFFLKENRRILHIVFTGLIIQVHHCLLGSSQLCALELDSAQSLPPLLHSFVAVNMTSDSSGLRFFPP